MTIAPDYHELHQAVDRLSPEQAEALAVVLYSMTGGPPEEQREDNSRPHHRLSFTATGSGPSDLAERAEAFLDAGGFRTRAA